MTSIKEIVASNMASLTQENQGKQTGRDKFCEKHQRFFDFNERYEEVCRDCSYEAREKSLQLQKIADAKHNLALPKRLESCTFENYIPCNDKAKAAKEQCRLFADDHTKYGGIIMLGGVGTGKTHLAAAICNELAGNGVTTKIATVPAIIREVRSTWSGNATDNFGQKKTEEDVIDKYAANITVLVIDEIGSQYGTDSEKIIISEIINDRYNNMLPTVIIGNITMSETEKYLGLRAVDRIRHGGLTIIFDWDTYRKPHGK